MSGDRMDISREAKAEAAAWLARLHSEARTIADERAFQAWLAAAPEHIVAFEALTDVWNAAGGLGRPNVTAASSPPTGIRLPRRVVLAGIGGLVAAGTSFSVWQAVHAGIYETGIGEQKHVTLSDGTQAFLDTDTRIRERFDDTIRKIELIRGRVNFNVAADPKRPFVVDAAGKRIVADRTVFDVRRDDAALSVVVLQGRATVSSGDPAQTAGKALAQGERAVASRQNDVHVDRPNLAPLVAWQTGQAVFENETLADAAREMNRYSTVRLEIADPAIAGLRMSGVYRVGDNQAFARSVAALLPVRVQTFAGHLVFVPDPTRSPQG